MALRKKKIKSSPKSAALELALIINSMTEGVLVFDKLGKLETLNQKAKQILGLHLIQEITTEEIHEQLKIKGLYKFLDDVLKNDKIISEEIEIKNRIKNCFYKVDITPAKSDGTHNAGVVFTLRDITKEKEIDKMKTDLVAAVSHELKTPLAIMRESVSIVDDEVYGKINSKQKMYLDVALDHIDRLERIITALLDISKIEAGKVQIRRTLIDIVKLATDVFDSYRLLALKKGLTLSTKFEKKDISVFADPDKINEVFTNLVNNALKFTDKGGINVEIKDRENEVECSVIDTGVGISQEDLPKLFTKFSQVGKIDKPGPKGTGLGLSIVNGIIKLHKGKIWVESKLGEGSKFTFLLPKYEIDQVFSEYVTNEIRRAEDNNGFFSLVIVSIPSQATIKEKTDPKSYESFYKNIEYHSKKVLRRVSDVVVRYDSKSAILLRETTKTDTDIIRGRIKSSIMEFLQNCKESWVNEVIIKIGHSTFPDDGATSEELLIASNENTITF